MLSFQTKTNFSLSLNRGKIDTGGGGLGGGEHTAGLLESHNILNLLPCDEWGRSVTASSWEGRHTREGIRPHDGQLSGNSI